MKNQHHFDIYTNQLSSSFSGDFSGDFCFFTGDTSPFFIYSKRVENLSSTFFISSFFLSVILFCIAVWSFGILFLSSYCKRFKASKFFYLVISLVNISVMISLSFFCKVYNDSQSSRIVTVPSSSPIAATFPPTIWFPLPE